MNKNYEIVKLVWTGLDESELMSFEEFEKYIQMRIEKGKNCIYSKYNFTNDEYKNILENWEIYIKNQWDKLEGNSSKIFRKNIDGFVKF